MCPRSADGEPGGDDGGGAGGGGGDWYGRWDGGEPDDEPDSGNGSALAEGWVWNACLALVVLQTLHFILLQGNAAQRVLRPGAAHAAAAGSFATISQAFFTRRGGLRALPPPPPLRLQFARA